MCKCWRLFVWKTLKELFEFATLNGKYANNIDLFEMGVKTVDDHLSRVLQGIENSIQQYSANNFASYPDLLSLKAMALYALGRIKESKNVIAHANLRNRIYLIDKGLKGAN